MPRPPREVAGLVRAAGERFVEKSRAWLSGQHLKVLSAIERCRTAALGGHLDECSEGGHSTGLSYNSCRQRHCPKCPANTRQRWLEARRRELLPLRYRHAVFTRPRQLAALALQNKRVVDSLLFRSRAETLLQVARDPQRLGAEIGFFSVLHTGNQKLDHHAHVHWVVAAGGLSADHRRWVTPRYDNFFLPQDVLAEVFRGKFTAALPQAFVAGRLGFQGRLKPLAQRRAFAAFRRTLFRNKWVGDLRPPFGGPPAGVALPRPLHPPRRDLQPSSGVLHRRSAHFPLAGCGSRQPAAIDDARRGRVSAALLAPPVAAPLRAHSLLRLAGSSLPRPAAASVPTAAGLPATISDHNEWHNRTISQGLELSLVWRADAGRRRSQPGAAPAAFAATISRRRLMPPYTPAPQRGLLRPEPPSCASPTRCRAFLALRMLWQDQNHSLPRVITAPRGTAQPLCRPRTALDLPSGLLAEPIQNA